MSPQPQEVPPIPEETRRVARAAFHKANVYIRMRDARGVSYHGQLFAPLFPMRGQPAIDHTRSRPLVPKLPQHERRRSTHEAATLPGRWSTYGHRVPTLWTISTPFT
jgi:hypothetical protein